MAHGAADFTQVRELLSRDAQLASRFGKACSIHHIDVTCDGCETEPIIGSR